MRPLLLIDAGNTRIKWARTRLPQGKIVPVGDAATATATPATIKRLARSFPDHHAMLACVVPRLLSWFQGAFGNRLQVLSGESRDLPLHFAYRHPAELGADRLAAAIAAQASGRFPAIVISCGTATAISVLDAQGHFCGGVIAPGLQAQLDALLLATAQLPETSLRTPRRLPASSTEEAIRAGVLLSYRGGVREMVARLQESLPGKGAARIVLTGGDAGHFKTMFGGQAEVRPLLVFEGLRIMGARLFFASVS